MKITKKPPTLDEVINKKGKVISGMITVPENHSGYPLGTIATTKDAGKNWSIQDKPLYQSGETHYVDAEVFHNGASWKNTTADNTSEPSDSSASWDKIENFDANGVLIQNATKTGNYSFMTDGNVREKHLKEYDSSMAHSLFKNKIFLK